MINPKSVALTQLPFVPANVLGSIKSLNSVLSIPVVYFFLLESGYPVYIGESKNLAYRLLNHDKKYLAKKLDVCKIAWFPSATVSYQRRQIEKRFIRYYLPPLNFTIWHGKGGKSHFEQLRQLRENRFGVKFD